MPSTYIAPQTGNVYSSTTFAGGYVPGSADVGGHFMRYVDEFVDALEPYNTPFLSKIKKGKSANQPVLEWGQRHQRPHRTTLQTTMTGGQTSLVVASGDGKIFSQYMVLRLIDATLGDEIVWVNSAVDGTDTLPIVRAQAGTSATAHTTTTCTAIEIIGTAEPTTGVDHPVSPIIYGDWAKNYFQRFGGSIPMDRQERHTPNFERNGDQLLSLIEEEAKNQKLLLEKALIRGLRQQGTPVSGAVRPGLMGGIPQFLGTTTANATALSSSLLSIYDIETLSNTVWSAVGDNLQRTLCMSMNTKRIFNRLINNFRQADMNTTSIKLKLDRVELETGAFDVMVVRYMPDGEIWGLDFSKMELVPYEGLDWHVEDQSQSTRGDWDLYSISGDFSFMLKNEPSMWRLSGFDTTASNYPTATL